VATALQLEQNDKDVEDVQVDQNELAKLET